ncbi:Protein of unknown function [Acinetobacter marinus]|uniref:Glycosyltransferase 61 catalytic domain-containing protein n=1 Tax=Acinetobacter marinus TaxID=281375 RepID=A0A1G6L0A9_9GAMM|nr:glycosyltransferase family 61 protein [Acinetobacter marinus]SDC36789.1 Protein of unknown function [Acinetobacter marinus]
MNTFDSQLRKLHLGDTHQQAIDKKILSNSANYTAAFLDIIFKNGVSDAEKFISLVKNDKKSDSIAQAIKVSENQVRDLKKARQSSLWSNDADFVTMSLDEYVPRKTLRLTSWVDLDQLVVGSSAIIHEDQKRKSTFAQDFSQVGTKSLLSGKGFEKEVSRRREQRIDVLSNVRFSVADPNFYSVVIEDRFFNRKLCSRLAKLSNQVLLSKNEVDEVDEAIILPIAHIDSDYFQHLSEMWSGLALVDYFPKNLPIVYTEDTYGILDLLCERLGVDRSRFKSFLDMQDIRVKKAYQIHPVGGNLWDAAFFEHFNKYNSYEDSGFKVFLANPKGGVEIKNKDEVCKVLRDLGFLIVHPEDLPVSKLIDLFQRSSLVVTATSKVLANTAFMQRGSSLVELQDAKSIKSDYYLRTRFNDMNYDCVVVNSGVVDVDELLTVLASRSV